MSNIVRLSTIQPEIGFRFCWVVKRFESIGPPRRPTRNTLRRALKVFSSMDSLLLCSMDSMDAAMPRLAANCQLRQCMCLYLNGYIHYITLHSVTLRYITLHCIPVHYTTLHCITLHCIPLHYIALHYIAFHYITLHCIPLHYIASHCMPLHYITLHYTTLHCIPLRYITLHCIPLQYIG